MERCQKLSTCGGFGQLGRNACGAWFYGALPGMAVSLN
jgi:hypothetical protein